jgi:serine/threonine-protein kinase RsbT
MNSTSHSVEFQIKDEISFNMTLAQIRSHLIKLECSDVAVAKLLTATSELARNIIKYAEQGTIKIDQIGSGFKKGIEVTAFDKGPGIEDLNTALSDNFSSSGTLGLGLPGVKRMMDAFNIESIVGNGTTVRAILWL